MCECRLLFFGDIVGHPGRVFLKEQLPALKERYTPDFIFANGENATGGFGLNKAIAQELKDLNIDGITLGNHVWNQREFWNEIGQLDYVCRPLNLPESCPGNTSVVFDFKGHKLVLLNLLGRAYSREALDCPYKAVQHQIEKLKLSGVDNFVVDVHAEATAEKYTLGWFLSGIEGVSCVVGTHTHIQTADERILNETTAFILCPADHTPRLHSAVMMIPTHSLAYALSIALMSAAHIASLRQLKCSASVMVSHAMRSSIRDDTRLSIMMYKNRAKVAFFFGSTK